ncbi:MAG TPA: hypothetical protein VHL31_04070 [Geminicoccus sp.]|jgi:hypothetical protein|uniref:hypothetical protein n=1 Tax=Geminicoccus sp. TaxID=2024832 RepID=UPI002E3512A9|nr:hypothetical protein [Geminicoccus sp.]HEX2525467.1 hypothetical protein [Geminicoccus sp.]
MEVSKCERLIDKLVTASNVSKTPAAGLADGGSKAGKTLAMAIARLKDFTDEALAALGNPRPP